MKRFRLTDLALLPFAICVAFLILLGKLCGLTYQQISVVFNLWLQGLVLAVSAMLPAALSIYWICDGFTAMRLLSAVMLFVYAGATVLFVIKVIRRYHLPFDRAFDRCVHDLQVLARKWHTTYQAVNLLIFVVAFLVIVILNLWMSHQIAINM